jgi:hypothetical protein
MVLLVERRCVRERIGALGNIHRRDELSVDGGEHDRDAQFLDRLDEIEERKVGRFFGRVRIGAEHTRIHRAGLRGLRLQGVDDVLRVPDIRREQRAEADRDDDDRCAAAHRTTRSRQRRDTAGAPSGRAPCHLPADGARE